MRILLRIRKTFAISLAIPHGIRTGPGPATESGTRAELDLGKPRVNPRETKTRQEFTDLKQKNGEPNSGNR
jgi:hypothetical protein